MIMIIVRCWFNPALGPPVEFADRAALWRERWASLLDIWPIIVLIVRRHRRALLRRGFADRGRRGRRVARDADRRCCSGNLTLAGFIDASRMRSSTTAQLFFVGIGAVLYTKFLALSGTADCSPKLVGNWALDPLLLVIAVSIIYLVLGMFLDPLGMILLTIPVFVPMFERSSSISSGSACWW